MGSIKVSFKMSCHVKEMDIFLFAHNFVWTYLIEYHSTDKAIQFMTYLKRIVIRNIYYFQQSILTESNTPVQ